MFVHLNCHSHYSLQAGVDSIDALAQAAAAMGCPALALTDTDGLYGAVSFHRAARAAGIRPIYGAEISGSGERSEPRAVILAKDLQGFGEVCAVITDRHLDPGFSLARRLGDASDRVVILSADSRVLDAVARARGAGNLYAELSRLAGGRASRDLLAFARRRGLPVAATNRVLFLRREGFAIHRLLAAIRTGTTLSTLPEGAAAPPASWMKTPAEMARLFADVPEAVQNTRRIAERCNVTLPIGEILFPRFPLPAGETPSSRLEALTRRGVRALYPGRLAEATRRLDHELKVINGLSFAPYFLIVWDVVREARSRGIPTVGRGSAANSLVCRALGITEVDPLGHNLYFERFLNPERTDYPDIDIDFPWNRRDEMLDYVFDKYGRENVALISAHVHFRGRSALREVGRALGIPGAEIDALTRALPYGVDVARLGAARETIPECRHLPLEDEPYRGMIALAQQIEGLPRHLSIHCGGIVISPFPIIQRMPLQKTPKGFVVTQFDMYPVEDMGLLKIDLLAQKGLAVLTDTVRAVAARHNVRIDFARLDPARDPATRALIRRGDTIGCFYIESPGMRNLLKKLRVESFEMLTAASSIIRPGVADSGMMKAFIDRHNSREAVRTPHPRMARLLRDTFGVMIYQEDVIKVVHDIAGMSLGEADRLRKCMSKKRNWEDIRIHRERFLSGAVARGVRSGAALEIWRQIESFAGYAFCKAHSASFAIVSYQTAYLKAHHPAEFMAAVLSNRGGFYAAAAYVEEARRMGLTILPPCVNASEATFTAVARPGGRNREAAGGAAANAIRVGLGQFKNVGQCAIDSILAERRRGGSYTSLADFLSRAAIGEAETEALILAGACDALGGTRPELLWQLQLLAHGRKRGVASLPGFFPFSGATIPTLPDYTLREKLLVELACLDITVSAHLLSLYDIEAAGRVPAKALRRLAGRVVTLTGWLVHAKRTRTVKNEFMKFLMLEDATAAFEVTLFPRVYRRFGPLLYDRGPYTVTGRVEQEGDCLTVTAHRLSRVAEA
ncbi:MAG: DNA polymerase III subunit alpha [Nitrospinaceae bacterium]|nr:MAG: DNA polymerase III subunit alpha [Nitrospinaceae bacterium]